VDVSLSNGREYINESTSSTSISINQQTSTHKYVEQVDEKTVL